MSWSSHDGRPNDAAMTIRFAANKTQPAASLARHDLSLSLSSSSLRSGLSIACQSDLLASEDLETAASQTQGGREANVIADWLTI